MHILIGKRQIILSALVVVLGLAVFVNWYFASDGKKLSPEGGSAAENPGNDAVGSIELVNASENDYFAAVRLERSTARDKSLEELNNVMTGVGENSDAAVEVSAMIDKISKTQKLESDIETMVNAELGSECVAVVSDGGIEVVVSRDSLNDESALKISDIINTVCPDGFENVKICAAMG